MIGQNVFWANVCLKLTNRIMTRSYAEFMQLSAKPTKLQVAPQGEEIDPDAERQAQELNSMLGMI